MANTESGSRSSGVDHDFLAAFLGGDVQRKHWDSLIAAGLQFPGMEEDLDPPEMEAQERQCNSTPSDADANCSSCCSALSDCDQTEPPRCNTQKPVCNTEVPQCQAERHHHHKEPHKHASWFDRP